MQASAPIVAIFKGVEPFNGQIAEQDRSWYMIVNNQKFSDQAVRRQPRSSVFVAALMRAGDEHVPNKI